MIRQQLIYVTASFASGMIIMLAYDVLLIMRIIIRRPFVLTAFEDVIFWLAAEYLHFMCFTDAAKESYGYMQFWQCFLECGCLNGLLVTELYYLQKK